MSTDQLPLARIGALMRASTDAVAREVHALGPLARVRPAPGEWCANEIVGHLLEADRRGFIGRVGAVLAADGVVFQPWDQPAVAAARHDAERDPEGLLAAWLGAREADLGLVATLPASALDRSGTHPAVGELTIGNLLHEWVHHDREHLGQLLGVAQALVRPGMGNARRFSDPAA